MVTLKLTVCPNCGNKNLKKVRKAVTGLARANDILHRPWSSTSALTVVSESMIPQQSDR